MKGVAALVVLCVLVSGCDSGSERKSAHPLDRDQAGQSLREGSEPREGERITEPTGPAGSERRVVREERSLVLTFLVSWWWWLVYYSAGAIIGVIVYRDANARKQLAMNIRPVWWFLIVLFDAALGLLVYWVMNYSSLARLPAGDGNKSDIGG